jgi:hypothetical protein
MSASYCDRLLELLAQRGDTTARLEQEILDHIASCQVCRAEVAALSRLIARYGRTEPMPLSGDLEARLLNDLCVRLRR